MRDGLRRALAEARARGSSEGTQEAAEIARDPIDGNRRHPLVRTRSRVPESHETTRLRAFQRAIAEMSDRFTEEEI